MWQALSFALDTIVVAPNRTDKGPGEVISQFPSRNYEARVKISEYYGKRPDGLGRGKYFARTAVKELNVLHEVDFSYRNPKEPFAGLEFDFAELAIDVLRQRSILFDDEIRLQFARMIAAIELEIRNPISLAVIHASSVETQEPWVTKVVALEPNIGIRK